MILRISLQFRQSLKDIDFPNKPDPNPGKVVFPDLEAHEGCEGSAIPAVMRRLILTSDYDSSEVS